MTGPEPSPPPEERQHAAVATVALLVVILLVVAALFLWRPSGGQPSVEGPGPGPGSSSAAPAPGPASTGAPTSSPPGSAGPSGPSGPAQPPAPVGTECVPAGASSALTVLTYNIKSGRFRGNQLAGIAAQLRHWRPDVVLLQEVDVNRIISGRADQAAVLGEALGHAHAFGLNVRHAAGGQYGTAILSRHPLGSATNIPLPNRRGLQQRGLLHVTVTIRGLPVSLYTTHLEHTSAAMRLSQIRAVGRVLAADPLPKVLGGDLNATPGTAVLATARSFLTDTWAAAAGGPGATAPAGRPRVRIDYLMHDSGDDPATTLEAVDAEVLAGSLSDHRPVWASYRLTRTESICVPVLGD